MASIISILRTTARGTRWSQLADYVSPALFKVMPMRKAIAQVRELAANAKDGPQAADVRAQVASAVDERLSLAEPADTAHTNGELSDETRREIGEATLHLYFRQLLTLDVAILDLRLDCFSLEQSRVWWRPANLLVRWDGEFLSALRSLYRGFYSDDQSLLDEGIERLGLQKVREPLVAHLGGADPSAMRFSMQTFHESFHNVFEACREQGVVLHPNFLPLGVFLACLYETLEKLGCTFDVRQAFARAET